jgi:hypothetical protein
VTPQVVTIASIVEGHGEVSALPKLLHRLAKESPLVALRTPKPPWRRPRGSLIAPNGIEREVESNSAAKLRRCSTRQCLKAKEPEDWGNSIPDSPRVPRGIPRAHPRSRNAGYTRRKSWQASRHRGTTAAQGHEAAEDLVNGASLTLDDETLDRIDEIVPPGTNLYNDPRPAAGLRACPVILHYVRVPGSPRREPAAVADHGL